MLPGLSRGGALLAALAVHSFGCADAPAQPARLGLRLAPATLGTSLSLQQHLRIERQGRVDELDAALEIDAERLDMVGLALGQRIPRALRWPLAPVPSPPSAGAGALRCEDD